ncbi:RdgB/HAM1 family non-canonical purine NTP pyrophosphatase [Agromyces seonyuensis]|uniref:dITP/XTP pyrophosphatase n=1 Tax=Agromyces seonyuensis TaxID=2662446 RepID=A0A6I4P2R9_9MICO|nr:RdgB/HAM1 family non-canonical purine NTP pyrophosphatase [Agromyces seonyuensis]
MTRKVVLATHNLHKVEEFQRILGERMPDLEVVPYDGPEPVEDGTSFAENGLIKARAAAAHTGLVALADDSGIGVAVLGGSPGIFSARWSGTRDSIANLELLLAQTADVRDRDRAAWFTCAIAIATPDGAEEVVEGRWDGRLARAASGAGGFGYDPIFLPAGIPGFSGSAADLAPEEKNAVSHRARAFEAAAPVLERLLPPA